MIVVICAKYKKNPSRTVDATERTRFSKSRSNDLEDIGQGQRSSHATHLLMLEIICTIYGKKPSGTVDATGRTRKVNGQTDRRTDGQTDRQTGWIQYTPPNFVAGGIIMIIVNLLRLSDAYMCRWTGSSLVKIMACRCSAPSHYLNQCWNIVNWTFRNKNQWNWNWNSNIFIQEIVFENIVCKMASILSRPQWVKCLCSAKPLSE